MGKLFYLVEQEKKIKSKSILNINVNKIISSLRQKLLELLNIYKNKLF